MLLSHFIKAYNYTSITPNTTLDQLLSILEYKKDHHTTLIVKENGVIQGYLPLYKVFEMVKLAQKIHRNWTSIIVELFFEKEIISMHVGNSIKEIYQLFQTTNSPFIIITNHLGVCISVLYYKDILDILYHN